MALSGKERLRRWREKRKSDPVRDAEYIRKTKLWNDRRKTNAERSEDEKRKIRKQWRAAKARKKNREKIAAFCPETPPDSPVSPISTPPSDGRRPRQAVLRRNRKKEKNDLKRAQEEGIRLKKQVAKWKKRFQRLEAKTNKEKANNDSPNSKSKQDASCKSTEKIRRQLFQRNILQASLKEVYRNGNVREKRALRLICYTKIAKKYRGRYLMSSALGLTNLKTETTKNTKKNFNNLKRKVHDFFCRDDISSSTAGKKETKTRHKVKVQKRLMSYE